MRTTPRPGRARRRGWGLKRREKQSREIGLKRREKQSREGNPKRREKQSREGNPKRREKQSRESRGGGGPARTRPRSPRAIRLAEPTVTTGGRGERASLAQSFMPAVMRSRTRLRWRCAGMTSATSLHWGRSPLPAPLWRDGLRCNWIRGRNRRRVDAQSVESSRSVDTPNPILPSFHVLIELHRQQRPIIVTSNTNHTNSTPTSGHNAPSSTRGRTMPRPRLPRRPPCQTRAP